MEETQQKPTDDLMKAPKKGSCLDSGFPSVAIIVLITMAVVFFQIISGWKVMNISNDRAELRQNQKNHEYLLRENERLRGEYNKLNPEIKDLQAQQTELTVRSSELKRDVALLETSNHELMQTIEFKKKQRDELLNAENKLEQNISSLAEKLARAKQDIFNRENEKISLDGKLSSLNSKYAELQQDISKQQAVKELNVELDLETEKLKETLIKLKTAANDTVVAIGNTWEQASSEGTKLKDLNNELTASANNLSLLSQKYESTLIATKARLDGEMANVSSSTNGILEQTEILKLQAGKLKEFVTNIEAEYDVRTLSSDARQLNGEVSKIKEVNADLIKQLDVVEDLIIKLRKNVKAGEGGANG